MTWLTSPAPSNHLSDKQASNGIARYSAAMSTDLGPVARLPLSLEIAGRLRSAILAGDLGVDQELPTESELTRTFEVGRSTIREALRVLQSQGLITGAESVSTTRPRVTHSRTTPTAVAALSTALQVKAVALADLVDLRVLVEAATMRSITTVPDEARACLTRMRSAAAAGDIESFHLSDVEFHVCLAYAGGNTAIGLVVEVLRDSIASHLRAALGAVSDPVPVLTRLCEEHEGIVADLDAGDGDGAADRVVAHVRDFYETA